ncbi:prolyl oligopeptidase family serine peptidase [Ferrimicrobium sp.]|uniref:S9 family peptidase n=1 Tax=Ferrimicrobium sp. TaxID=2926050 RepID=UPI0026335EE0|nr:prolyl oligopeptidase family serine peptidase [Ferrimicrobium sp.]
MHSLAPLKLSDLALRPIPGMTLPSQVAFTPRGTDLYYLAPHAGDRLGLFRFDITNKKEHLVVSAPGEGDAREAETLEEELRKQRLRQTLGGVGGFQILDDARALVNIGGTFQLVGLPDGATINGYDLTGLQHLQRCGDDCFVATTGTELVVVFGDGRREQLVAAAGDGMSVGLAEYVAQEELGRMSGLWLDKSGHLLVYTEIDESKVAEHLIVRTDVHPNMVERFRYPMVGATNASVVVCLFDLETRNRTVIKRFDDESYLANVVWLDQDRVVISSLNRAQDCLTRWVYRPSDRSLVELDVEQGDPWVNLPEREFAVDGDLVTTSEAQDHQRHLIRLHPDGTRTQIGALVIRELLGVEGTTALVVATGDEPTQEWLYRVDLVTHHCERVAVGYGAATGVLAPDGRSTYVNASSRDRSPVAMLDTLGEPVPIRATSVPFELFEPEMIELTSATGETLYGAVYLPPPERREGAPLIVSVYGGPHAQLVVDHFGLTMDLQAQYLAQQGAVVVKLDNRGSYGRGLDFEAYLRGRFGQIELEDQLRGVEYCQRRYRLDPERVGIYGWSYGGYMTLLALTRAPEVFSVGVAGAPVVDFRWYDTAYTERYLGDPIGNEEGYERSSVLDQLEGLRGRLMIIHGMMDENVHFGHTSSLLGRANELSKDIELVVLPASRHAPADAASLGRVAKSRTRFLLSNLGLAGGLGEESSTS